MLERNPDLFLKPLADALFISTANDGRESISVRNAHFFYAAKSASIARLIELDRIIPEFEKLSNEGRTLERMFEENRLLYGFFTNALSAIESFCFAAYFLGTALKKSDFEPEPNLRRTNPKRTLSCFGHLYSNSPFTKALRGCIWSEQYAAVSDIRNMLSHRFTPGRILRPMVDIQSWNLDVCYEGDWSSTAPAVKKSPRKKAFQIDTKSLIDLRDWVDKQLELLGKKLQKLAVSKGLGCD